MDVHLDLSQSLVRRRPRAPRSEALIVFGAGGSIASFLGAGLALVSGAIGTTAYLTLSVLALSAFTASVLRLR